METNARYLLVGSFTLAVLASVFGFVFWLDRTGGMGERRLYAVRFEQTVSGLQPGAAVLFDGLRVGEVSSLKLDPADARHVIATIAVASGTPVRRDTKAGMEYQGLMGTAAVSLEGGASDEALEAGSGTSPPLLVADAASSRSLTQAAQGTLARVDKVIGENSEALHASIDNIKTFSGALSRNSGRLDGVMEGLERMTGGGPAKPTPMVYDLAVPKLAAWPTGIPRVQFAIPDPTAVIALQTQRLLARAPDGQLTSIGDVQWSDTLPKMLQEKIIQAFNDAGIAATTVDPLSDQAKGGRVLTLDLRSFQIASGSAVVGFSAKIVSGDGKIIAMRVFGASSPASDARAPAAVEALNAAFCSAVGDLAAWMQYAAS